MEIELDEAQKIAILTQALDDIHYDVTLAKAGALRAVSHGVDVTAEVVKRYESVKFKIETVIAAYEEDRGPNRLC